MRVERLGRCRARRVAPASVRPAFAALVSLAAVAALCCVGCVGCAGGPGDLHVVDLAGVAVDPLTPNQAPATVLLFVRTDCPISNRYAPEVRRLYDAFVDRGVRFWLVYPGPAGPPEGIRAHIADYGFPMPPLLDPRFELVSLVEATVTPEVAVFTRDGDLAYRGRIDDRYLDFGKAKAAPDRRDLADALEAVLAGKAVEQPRTRAIGCYIQDLG